MTHPDIESPEEQLKRFHEEAHQKILANIITTSNKDRTMTNTQLIWLSLLTFICVLLASANSLLAIPKNYQMQTDIESIKYFLNTNIPGINTSMTQMDTRLKALEEKGKK